MFTTLLVDDSEAFRDSLARMLTVRFPMMDVLHAKSAEDALRIIAGSLPQLVVADVKLPGDNGLTLTRRVKDQYPEIIVVLLTNFDLPEYREAALRSGADHFFWKGEPSSEVLEVVGSMLAHMQD